MFPEPQSCKGEKEVTQEGLMVERGGGWSLPILRSTGAPTHRELCNLIVFQ